VSLVDTGPIPLPRVGLPAVRGPVRRAVGGQTMRVEAGDDASAFAEFVGSRGPGLVRLARGLLRDPYQAEDIVQDVFARALVQWRRVSAADDVDAYVRRMVVNACTSWFRRAVRREFAHDTATLPERAVADPSGAVTDRDRVLGLLRRLPPRQRAVLVLRHYEGLPDAQIAALMGTSEVTVRSNAHRGLASLRRLMAEDEPAARGTGGGRAS
jgi:RNA polymerase sigma-70 factor (sigma-E family)